MNDTCRDTNKCWAYYDAQPSTGCADQCGGDYNLTDILYRWYTQMMNDYHENNPRLKRVYQHLKERGRIR